MHVAFVTCGLPGPAYHGGAVTCWAIVKAIISQGHKITVLSLFDCSRFNPYLETRHIQTYMLREIGSNVVFVDYNYDIFAAHQLSRNKVSSVIAIKSKFNEFLKPPMTKYFQWAWLKVEVQDKLEKIAPDVIFVYHFDALSAVYDSKVAPKMAGVGDLWHLPSYYRLKARDTSFRKYFSYYPNYLVFKNQSVRLMLKMLRTCDKKGAFAAHYASWIRQHNGFRDALYLRTPVHDPVGDERHEPQKQPRCTSEEKPKILMIGDITGTASGWGLRILIHEVLPTLERRFGRCGFELNLVGSGKIDNQFRTLYERPYIKIKGRVVPPDQEFLNADILFVPTPIKLGIRVRIIAGFSYGSCIVSHTANTAGIPELVHEENSLLADNGKGLAQEIIRALEDDELRKKLKINARATYEQYFSENTAAINIVKELESLSRICQ